MTLDLLEETLLFVHNHIYPRKIALRDWKVKEGDVQGAQIPKFNDKSWRTIGTPFPWGGYDKMAWFRREITVPQEFSGKTIVLLIDLPESLLFLNGTPRQGIDQHHQEVLLSAKARGNQRYSVAIQSSSGKTIEQSIFRNAEIAELFPPARSLYFGLKTLRDLAQLFGTPTNEGKEIRELIRRTLIYLKYFKPDGDEYPNAIGRAQNFLATAVGTEFRTSIPGLVHLTGSALLNASSMTLSDLGRRTAETFSTVNLLMDEYPEFVFGEGQAARYEFIEREYPELFKITEQRITEGRWELFGGSWVEPDCNIPSGESLVRQLLYGKRWFKSHFGREPEVAWFPGSYGFNANLPQLLSKAGFRYFVATKLLLNDTNKFPHNVFWWNGIDRSKILAYIPPTGFESVAGAKDLKRSWDSFQQKETGQDYLLAYGYGESRIGPSKENLEFLNLSKNIPGVPKTCSSSVAEFFKQIEQQYQEIPAWTGELYLEKYRGTYTTNARVKQNNRRGEEALSHAETLSTLSFLASIPIAKRRYPQEELEQYWKQLLSMQDRSILTGTALAEVYPEVQEVNVLLTEGTQKLVTRAVESLTDASKKGKPQSIAMFNPLSWSRSAYAILHFKTTEKDFSIRDNTGEELEYQIVERTKHKVAALCYIRSIAPLSFMTLTISPEPPKVQRSSHWKISRHVLESPSYRIRLDNKGGISSLYDRQQRRELIKKNKRGNTLQTFSDKPKQSEAWELDSEFRSKQSHQLQCKSVRIVEQGPLRVVVRMEYRSIGLSRVTQDMILYHQHRRIDFVTNIRWFEKQTILKAAFPFDIKSHQPTYEIQFGAVTRTSKQSTPFDQAKFEVPALRWADLSDAKGGVSLLNDSNYGYDAELNTLRLTLLRSPHFAHPIDPGRLSDNRLSDQGDHTLRYALFPHQGDWKKGSVVRQAKEFSNPLLTFPDRVARAVAPLVASSHPNIMIDTIKKAEDSDELTLRVYEAHGEPRETSLEFGSPILNASECDLLENVLTPLKSQRSKLKVKFKPFEVKTIKVSLKPFSSRK
jgi:alpha-mannosidase